VIDVAILSLIFSIVAMCFTGIGIFLSDKRIRESNKLTEISFRHSYHAKENEFTEKYHDLIYRSEHGKQIIECIKNKPHMKILVENGGSVSERDLENFMNDLINLSTVCHFGIIDSKLINSSFGWVLDKVHNSPEIINYIKKVQDLQQGHYYQSIIEGHFNLPPT